MTTVARSRAVDQFRIQDAIAVCARSVERDGPPQTPEVHVIAVRGRSRATSRIELGVLFVLCVRGEPLAR